MNGGYVYSPSGFVKNFDSLRKWCYWAGIFGVVQSIIWIGLTLTGILSYSCVIKIDDPTFNYGNLFRVVFIEMYFLGSCAPDTIIPKYNDYMLKSVETVLNPQDLVIWNGVYLAVAICWLLASVLLMSFLKQDQPRLVSGILWTWILVTFCICSMDLALGIIFGVDYGRFNRKAYDYNLSDAYAGPVTADAAQLLAGMVASMSMMIMSLKGFVLWIINAGLMIYLTVRAIYIGYDHKSANNLFLPRKESDDIIATRPPINAYQEEDHKPTAISTVFTNESFEPDNRDSENISAINNNARAAIVSMDVSLQERRFRNLENFQQYPPRSRPESVMPETYQQQQQPNSPIVVAAFPAPDYTPPMQRAAQNPNRNQRYH